MRMVLDGPLVPDIDCCPASVDRAVWDRRTAPGPGKRFDRLRRGLLSRAVG